MEDIEYVGKYFSTATNAVFDGKNWNVTTTLIQKRSKDGISWDKREAEATYSSPIIEEAMEVITREIAEYLGRLNFDLFNDHSNPQGMLN